MTVAPHAVPAPDRTPVVVAARRTPVGTAGHSLADVDVTGLATPVLAALRADLTALGIEAPVDEVVLGNVMGPGGQPGEGRRAGRRVSGRRCRG